MKEQLEFIERIIAERRTVKPENYTGEAVDDHFVKRILAQANWAPTHGYTEPWRFVVLKGEALEALGQFLAGYDQPSDTDNINTQRFNRLAQRPLLASHVIGIGMRSGTNPKIPQWEEIASVAMAVQNMWLMTHALGLMGYWSTGTVGHSTALRDFLGFPKEVQALGLFYLGRSTHALPSGRRLSEIEAKTEWRG